MIGGEKKEKSETSELMPKKTDSGDNSDSEEKKDSEKRKEKPEEDETEEEDLIDEFDEENVLGFGTAFR